jgi:hypothetical protein
LLIQFSLEIQSKIFEWCFIASEKNQTKNIDTINLVLVFFEDYHGNIPNISETLSWILQDFDKLRVYSNNNWIDANENYKAQFKLYKENELKRLINNPYKVYGQISKYTKSFCIRDVSVITEKKHTRTVGKNCKSWTKNDLIALCIRLQIKFRPEKRNKFDTDEEYLKSCSLNEICSFLQKWFRENNLLIEDPNCGRQGKTRTN